MIGDREYISLTTPVDTLGFLGHWVRAERQRRVWTQAELARRSGVPAATISRLELKGLGSTDSLFKVLFALNALDVTADFLKEALRRAQIPTSLSEVPRNKPVMRIRPPKEKR